MEINRPVFNRNENERVNIKPVKQTESNTNNVVLGTEEKTSAPKTFSKFGKKFWIILLIFLIAFVVTVVSVVTFTGKDPILPTDIIISLQANGEYDFSTIDRFETSTDEYTINLMPGDEFKGAFNLKSISNEEDPTKNGTVFVRFRLFSEVEQNYHNDIFDILLDTESENYSNWFRGLDGYYYFEDLLDVNEEISIETYISINEDKANNYFQGKSITINCIFEVLQTSAYQSITEVWTGAPYLWRMDIVEKVLAQ